MGKIITVCNQKGGVGKTTTAINLSAFLALLGQTALLVDADPQGNATSGLGVDRKNLGNSLYHVLIGEVPVSGVIIPTAIDRLFLVPSDLALAGAEVELVGVENREFCLEQILAPVKANYDYVFVDTPPSLGLLTVNALACADSVLIPVQCEYYALEGLSRLLGTFELVKKRLNPRLEIEGVLLTMADSRTRLSQKIIEEVKEFFGDRVYQTIIPRNVRLTEAPSFGRPIATHDPRSKGSRQYRGLAEEFRQKHSLAPEPGNEIPAEAGPAEELKNREKADGKESLGQGARCVDPGAEDEHPGRTGGLSEN